MGTSFRHRMSGPAAGRGTAPVGGAGAALWRTGLAIACAAALSLAPRPGVADEGEPETGAVDTTPVDYARFVPALIENFARPAASDLTESLVTLEKTISGVCAKDAGPDAAEAFDEAFAGAVAAHGRLAALRAGALADDARAERLAFVPDSRGVVRRQVTRLVAARDETATDPASLREKSVALQGLTALEWIAYDKTGEVVLGRAEEGSGEEAAQAAGYACAYAAALGARLEETSREVSEAFGAPSGQTALLLAPGPDNALVHTDKEAASFVFNALLTSLELARDQIVGPLLDEGPVTLRAARIPFSRSHTGFVHLAALIDGFADAIVAAGYPEARSDGAWIGNTLSFEAGNAHGALEAVDPDPVLALEGEKDLGKLTYVRTILDGLRPMVAGELAGHLDFKGGFNALDGD
uniref:imelysin family protein n=1 Tax=Stappia sp. TaxID=1870903 RepID=UPI003BACE392